MTTTQTQQRILRAFSQAFGDLDAWLRDLGLSEDQVVAIYTVALEENGVAAQLIANLTAKVFPSSSKFEIDPPKIIAEFRRGRSEEFATWILEQPEPDQDTLDEVLQSIKSALADLRQHFVLSGQSGPQHRVGGRPKELEDPEIRKEICAKIRARYKPGINKLDDVFRSVANEYMSKHSGHKEPVSPSTIKRIWLECEGKNEEIQ